MHLNEDQQVVLNPDPGGRQVIPVPGSLQAAVRNPRQAGRQVQRTLYGADLRQQVPRQQAGDPPIVPGICRRQQCCRTAGRHNGRYMDRTAPEHI